MHTVHYTCTYVSMCGTLRNCTMVLSTWAAQVWLNKSLRVRRPCLQNLHHDERLVGSAALNKPTIENTSPAQGDFQELP